MNPMTNVKNIIKLNEQELARNSKSSWHDMYKDSAWIFVGGLTYGLTEGDIVTAFSQYGEIVNINLVRDKKTGKTKGFCFLCYADQRSTVLAVDNFNGIKLCGRTLRVDHVAEYRMPKEHEDDDEITKSLMHEGCAPEIKTNEMKQNKPSSKPSCSNSEKPLDAHKSHKVKIKKEKRSSHIEKCDSEKPKHKKKHKRHRSRSSSSSSDEKLDTYKDHRMTAKEEKQSSHRTKHKKEKKRKKKSRKRDSSEDSSSESENCSKTVKIKKEKPDSGYKKYEIQNNSRAYSSNADNLVQSKKKAAENRNAYRNYSSNESDSDSDYDKKESRSKSKNDYHKKSKQKTHKNISNSSDSENYNLHVASTSKDYLKSHVVDSERTKYNSGSDTSNKVKSDKSKNVYKEEHFTHYSNRSSKTFKSRDDDHSSKDKHKKLYKDYRSHSNY